ncbi:TIGR02556 family CRISPR-associated protein [Aeribacillus pallidus]
MNLVDWGENLIEAVAQIGKLSLECEQKSTVDQLIEDPGYPYSLNILFTEKNGEFSWEGTEIEETSEDFRQYLFRNGSSRGTNYSPTARITTLSNTFNQKVLGWFKKAQRSSNSTKTYFSAIYKLLTDKQDSILAELEDKFTQLNDRAILSLKINGQFLYDIPAFVDAFLFLVNEKDLELSASNQICSICGQRKDTVIGKMSVFRFYTLDKPGFVAGGFDEQQAWRNYPVCLTCKTFIEEGRRIIEERLRFNFYGLSYLLVPKFILPPNVDDEDYQLIFEFLYRQNKEIRLQHKKAQSFMTTEEDILETLADVNNTLAVHLIFLQKIQSAERILLLIEDVLPSRLKELFKAKIYVEQLLYSEGNHPFHFGFIRTFFNGSVDKYFLHIVDSVFKERSLHFPFLLKFMMEEIRKDFYEAESNPSFFYKVRQAIAVVLFLEQSGVLERKGGNAMGSRFDSLFEVFGQQMDTNEKKAIFLLGALTQMLLEVQQTKRNSKPFLKQLMSLKMDERTIKGLLPKVINKLQEYDAYQRSHQQLAEEISTLFMTAQKKWRISVDELNFYFVCGMNLVSKVKDILFAKEEATIDAK